MQDINRLCAENLPPNHLILPLEVIEHIIDYLHDDASSLVQCSLVAKTWVHPSHYHLFHSMKITDDTTLNTFNEFAGLLGTSTIGQHVRHLHLYNGDFGVPLHGVEVNLLLLISILTHLRRLRSIQISSIYWRNDSLPLTELQLPTVTGLSLTHFPHQYEMHGIPAILHIFPCLKELRVLLDCSGDYPAPTTKELPLPPELQLEALHFWSPLSEPSLIRAISTTDSIKNMRSISVEVSTELYISPIGCLLLNSGSKLKDLSLDISDTDDILSAIDTNNASSSYSFWEPFGIQNCTALESLTLNLPIETSPIENTARLRAAHSWLSYFVGCITSTHLQQFIFYLRGTAEDIDAFIDIGDWEAFSHLLDTFPDLTSVAFFWSAEDWPELQKRCLDSEALVKLERLLPGLVKQGILELDYNAYSSRRMTELLSVKPDDVPWYGAKYRS